jgi:hypothetical protein
MDMFGAVIANWVGSQETVGTAQEISAEFQRECKAAQAEFAAILGQGIAEDNGRKAETQNYTTVMDSDIESRVLQAAHVRDRRIAAARAKARKAFGVLRADLVTRANAAIGPVEQAVTDVAEAERIAESCGIQFRTRLSQSRFLGSDGALSDWHFRVSKGLE